jgi:hypothetical protein
LRRAVKIKGNTSTDQKIDRLTQHVVQLIDVFESSQQQLQAQESILPGVIAIERVMKILGYDDPRSAKTWLRKQKITIIEMGKKTYISSAQFSEFINTKTSGVGNAIKINTATQRQNIGGGNKKKRGKAGSDFLNAVKNF